MRGRKGLVNRRRNTPPLTLAAPDLADLGRAERLREVLEDILEVNRRFPVVVEGIKDSRALRKLGLVGEIITFNRGKPVYEFCEDLSERYDRVVLLMDWDPEGERLMGKLGRELKGHWEEFDPLRRMLKVLCQKEVKDIEGMPKLLRRLEGIAAARG